MSSFLKEQLESLIEEVVLSELSKWEKEHPSHSLKALLDPEGHHRDKLGELSPTELEKIIKIIVGKKHGQAVFKKSDMEKLDKMTRWMKYIPGGTAYRKNLAKYLRSKKDVRQDPFKDFRKYDYSTDDLEENKEMQDEIETPEKQELYFHGTSVKMKPGSLVLPPSRTGKQSEKDRKKNLDVVFFTKDPRSALVYAGRATQSLGGTAAVYVVEPQGPIGTLNDTAGTTVFYAPYAKVIRPASKEELSKTKKKK